MKPTKSVLLISCGIFEEEIKYLRAAKKRDWQVLFLDAALHVNFDRLKAKLTETLQHYCREGRELRVLYGICHPEMSEILERYGAKRINAGNCLEAMVGPDEIARLDREATSFFLSAGWINHWEEMFARVKEDLQLDPRTLFDGYERIVVLDTGVIPIDLKKVERFSEFSNLPVVQKPINLDYLANLIESI